MYWYSIISLGREHPFSLTLPYSCFPPVLCCVAQPKKPCRGEKEGARVRLYCVSPPGPRISLCSVFVVVALGRPYNTPERRTRSLSSAIRGAFGPAPKIITTGIRFSKAPCLLCEKRAEPAGCFFFFPSTSVLRNSLFTLSHTNLLRGRAVSRFVLSAEVRRFLREQNRYKSDFTLFFLSSFGTGAASKK